MDDRQHHHQTYQSDFNLSIGFSNGTTSASNGAASKDGQGTGVAARRMAGKVLTIIDPSQTVLAEADVASWDSTNFTLNWTTNDANAYIIHFIAISGTDVSASIVNWTMKTSTGNKAVTGVGFKPTAVLHLWAGSNLTATPPASATNAAFGFGVMDFSGHQWATAILSQNGTATSDTQRVQQTDAALYAPSSSLTASKEASWVSMDSDGFTMNFTTADANAGQVYSLALSGLNVWAGHYNKTISASGARSPHDQAFYPEPCC